MNKNQRTLIALIIAALAIVLAIGETAWPRAPKAAAPVQAEQNANEAKDDKSKASDEKTDEKKDAEKADEAKDEESKEEEPADDERSKFVAEWAERIDAYNAGYPLEGYGKTFAEAAYDNNVDPRFSPAIARVESASGQVCAYSFNAWGWGTQSWSDWDTAIREHVAGLAQQFGHDLTYDVAVAYNESDPDAWYYEVGAVMEQI